MRELFSTDSLETSIRLQVCNVFCLLVTTIHQIYAVFYAGEGDTNQPGMYSLWLFIALTVMQVLADWMNTSSTTP